MAPNPPEQVLHYIYKLSIKGYMDHYIGATSNPARRKAVHFNKIYRISRPLFFGKSPPKNIHLMHCHLHLAKLLVKRKKVLEIDSRLKSEIIFEILFSVRNSDEAKLLEQQYILKKGCINKAKSSGYYHQKIKNNDTTY